MSASNRLSRRPRGRTPRDGLHRSVLVPGAGTGLSTSLLRSLRIGDPTLRLIGYHDDRFALTQSPADRNYLLPHPSQPSFPDRLRRLIERERIDLLVPARDADAELFARLRGTLPCRLFLPPHAVIERCQDKYRLTAFLRERRLPAPRTYAVDRLRDVAALVARFPAGSRLWCRPRRGVDSIGATVVRGARQARAWIRYWEEMRGIPAAAFTLAEYLPGRDFNCQSLWLRGKLVLIKTYERLDTLGGLSRPSGISSLSALAKTVRHPPLVRTTIDAVRALDPKASGTFGVDFRENEAGVACITEINAGRFMWSQPLLDQVGRHNMAVAYVRLALGQPVRVDDPYDVEPDVYMVRDVDMLPGLVRADELFEGSDPTISTI
jgi:carbamoylphosphate synthase large subunit